MNRQASGGLTIRPWVLSFAAVVVTLVWAINILAGLVIPSWQADAGVNAVMGALLALIGAIGGKSLLARPASQGSPTTPEGRPDES